MTRTSLRPRLAAASLLAILAAGVASGVAGARPSASAAGPTVVASTTWVAAIARLAGAVKVTTIAPPNLQHPPDYEPKASDLLAIRKADYVLVAGYEGFAPQVRKAAGGTAPIVTVATTYDPAALAASVKALGARFGTAKVAAANAASIRAALTKVCTALRAKVSGSSAVVVSHVVVADWAACAGLRPAGVFGPAPITPGQVTTLAKADPTVVFESWNMAGSGEAITGSTGASMVELENFPDGRLDLVAVARKNASAIARTLGG